MKILHVVPSFYPAHIYGGPIESVYALCRHSAEQDCQVKVLTTDANGLDQVLQVATEREVTLPGTIQVRYCRRLARHSVSMELLRRLLEYVRWADVVHLTAVYSFPTLPTLFACKLLNKPLVWSPRGALQRWQGSTKVGRKKLWQALCCMLAPRDFVLHVTSVEEAKESRAAFPRAHSAIIPNGVEIAEPSNHRPLNETFQLVFLGRLDPKKAIENLLDACARLQEKSTIDFALTIAGAGAPAYTQSLKERIAALELGGKVSMLGLLQGSAKETLFAHASVVIVPSHTENFAMVVAEALAHGVPVIASKGTPWQRLEENGCGLWVENDPNSLADAIMRMAMLPRKEMGERGRAWMKKEFAWRERAEEMIRLYQDRLRARAQTAPTKAASSAESAAR